jgi:hypothetical protein
MRKEKRKGRRRSKNTERIRRSRKK